MGESFQGLEVPGGDPGALRSAATGFSSIAAQTAIAAARLQVMPGAVGYWSGASSVGHAQMCLSNAGAGQQAFEAATVVATGAEKLARELEDAQRRVRHAIHDARDAQQRIDDAQRRVGDAQGRETAASGRIDAASHALTVSAMSGHPSPAAQAELNAAGQALADAQDDERRARHDLHRAQHDLQEAKKRGQKAMQDARDADKAAQAAFSAGAAMLPRWVVPPPPGQASKGSDDRPWWKQAVDWTGDQVVGAGKGIWDGVKGLGATGVMLYKLSAINQAIDPDSYNQAQQQLGDSLNYAWHHPGKFAEQVVDWDDLSHGRIGEWAGGLLPDAALAYATAGAGTAISRSTRAVRATEELETTVAKGADAGALVKPYKELRGTEPGKQSHHIFQDAAMRDLPGYKKGDAPTINLEGGSHVPGSPHDLANRTQARATVGGTYKAERRVAIQSLRAAGYDAHQIRAIMAEADRYFKDHLGMTDDSITRIPGNRPALQVK